MKLNEIKSIHKPNPTVDLYELDLWEEDGLMSVDVTVEVDYTAASHTDHPFGSTTAREHHPEELEITDVKLSHAAEVLDGDDNPSESLPAGTSLMTARFTTGAHNKWKLDALMKKVRDAMANASRDI